jgi:hypothetical protein
VNRFRIFCGTLLAAGFFSMSATVQAEDYLFQDWAKLWQSSCGSVDDAFSVLDKPESRGWAKADTSADEATSKIVELANANAAALADDVEMTGLHAYRRTEAPMNAKAVFQEFKFKDEPNSFLLGCAIYDVDAPKMSAEQLVRLSDERPYNNESADGLAIVVWPDGTEGSGRVRKMAGNIPHDHKDAAKLVSGLVLKTQFVFTESSE